MRDSCFKREREREREREGERIRIALFQSSINVRGESKPQRSLVTKTLAFGLREGLTHSLFLSFFLSPTFFLALSLCLVGEAREKDSRERREKSKNQ